jgi:hypothetical protein
MTAGARTRTVLRPLAAVTVALVSVGTLAVPGSATVPTAAVVVDPPEGAAKPTPGSGIGTAAAMEDERCNTGGTNGVYGRWNHQAVGGGPICVRPFAAGEKNGGATSRGVTADAIRIVAVLPSSQAQSLLGQSTSGNPVKVVDMSAGTYEDALHDWVISQMAHYETWGRAIDVRIYESSGTDEASQRADATEILAMKPFAVINFDTAGLEVLERSIAASKTLVHGYGTSASEAIAQQPYRWGASDTQAAAVNSAEVLGKQLVGREAVFAGDALKTETRKLGLVSIEDSIDVAGFEEELAEYKGSIAVKSEYPAAGGTFGDSASAGQLAPTMVQKMKGAGVTTVVLFTDVQMNKALMQNATEQNWFPEWFTTGTGFYDTADLARVNYPPEQWAHMFGLTSFFPAVPPLPPGTPAPPGTSQYGWFWGPLTGTYTLRLAAGLGWLLNGVHTAGPDLTPKTFKQGLWSMPAMGGTGAATASGAPVTTPLTGYGHTTGLPYPGYIGGSLDFGLAWHDPATYGRSGNAEGQGVVWFIDDGRHTKAGDWPKQTSPWFDKTQSIFLFPSRPAPPVPSPPCAPNVCPSSGATTPTPGAPSKEGFVAEVIEGTGTPAQSQT